MDKFTIFILILVAGSVIGDEFIRNAVDTIWLILWGAFIVFLIAFHILDGKSSFYKSNKKDREG